MAACSICGEPLANGARVCSSCGTSLPDVALAAPEARPSSSRCASVLLPTDLPADTRFCPGCGKMYDARHPDAFCQCGTELSSAAAAADFPMPDVEFAQPAAPSFALIDFPDMDAPAPSPVARPQPQRPAAGTPMLTLLDSSRQPCQYFPLQKDVTLVGRVDAVAGIFPEVDLQEWLEPAAARKVSRQHVQIVRHRGTQAFGLKPLPGNTGTQLETEMLAVGLEVPLEPGHRIILGGAVRLKFELA